jgi:hypothetical protein
MRPVREAPFRYLAEVRTGFSERGESIDAIRLYKGVTKEMR